MKRLVQYLADLAPQPSTRGTTPVKRKRDLLLLSDIVVRPRRRLSQQGLPHPITGGLRQESLTATTAYNIESARRDSLFPLEFLHNDEGIERFAKLDALSPDEHLLRLGFLWMSGEAKTADGVQRYLMPVMSAVARVHGFVRGMNEIELIEDFEIAEELGSPDTRDLIEDSARELMLDYLVFEHRDRDGRLAGFAKQIEAAFGLPPMTIEAADTHPMTMAEQPQLTITGGVGIYPARDVEKITVGSTIAEWASADLTRTAFAAMYRDTPAASPVPESSVKSPALLNHEQRRAIAAARSQMISVISGPPGTGKTHTVAALALDEIALGRSVLIATQSDHAARVVTEHLARMNVQDYVRFGHQQGRKTAADQLDAGIARPSRHQVRQRRERFDDAWSEHTAVAESIVRQLEHEAAAVARLRGHAAPLPHLDEVAGLSDAALDDIQRRLAKIAGARGWIARFRARRIAARLGARPNVATEAIQLAVAAYRATLRVGTASAAGRHDWESLAATASRSRRSYASLVETEVRARANRGDRKRVTDLANALRQSRRQRRQLLRQADPAGVLGVIPMWIGTLSEIDDILPAVPGMFDVVVFDEASQIEQVRAATALMRARRAVVVGDPRQLRHVSFVSDERMDEAAAQHGVESQLRHLADVRRNSLFDIAAATSPVIALQEHFRSVPHIIEFSNREFYSNRLRLMTQHPRNESRDAIRTVSVEGKRRKNGSNPEEVATVLELLGQATGSVGVVSPFRAQAEAIEEAAIAALSSDEIGRLGLKVGTAHAMQGSEHDTVIISLALDDESMGSLRFLEDPNLFNTMVTRARQHQVVLQSFTAAGLRDGLLAAYLQHADDPPQPDWERTLGSGWPGQLGSALRSRGFRVVADYPVAGWQVDLAVGTGPSAIGVVCGVHDNGPQRHIERQSALRRAGWEIVDAFESFYLASPEEAIEAVIARLLGKQVA